MIKSILSINGNRAMNYLLQTVFESDFDFIAVDNVYQGLHQMRTNRNIKALLLDVDYQSEQSWELIEHIKSSKFYQFPIVILTTTNNDILKQRCYQYEIDEIFFKPFNPMDITAAVMSIMSMDIATNG